MQSDGNRLCGDVVSDSFIEIYRDKCNILYQIYKMENVRIIIIMILILYKIICTKMQHYSSPKTQTYEFLVAMCCISLNMHSLIKIWNSTMEIFMIKIQKYLLFIFLVLNAVFLTVYPVKAVQDDISAKTVPIRLHQTVGLGWSFMKIIIIMIYQNNIECMEHSCLHIKIFQ